LWTTVKRRNPETGASYPWLVRASRVVNQYCFYGIDDDCGLFFIKLCSYFPYNGKVLINGHHFAQAQAVKARSRPGSASKRSTTGLRPATTLTGGRRSVMN
jgi:hypothetical protein